MKLLGLKRTKAEILEIIKKHRENGVYARANAKMWEKRCIQEGETKIQFRNGNPIIMIKSNGVLTPYARYRYQQLHVKLSSSQKVYFKDMNPTNITDDNLIVRDSRGLTKEEKKLYHQNCKKFLQQYKENTIAPKPVIQETKKSPEPEIKRIPVRLNTKTIVYVRPNQNVNNVIKKYQNASGRV
jgi:hypothetical protein